MDTDKKKACGAKKEHHSSAEEALRHKKKTVPGQQLGLYCEADKSDVRQMVRMLNSPEEEHQKGRG